MALTLTLLLTASGTASAADVPVQPVGVRPIGRPGDWVHYNDYPIEAMRGHVQGNVGFVLTIGPDGVPTKCEVNRSSGSAVLDGTSCELMMLRARFTPASDATGKPTNGRYASFVRWQLPASSTSLPGLAGPQADWATDNVYPEAALRIGATGTVFFEVSLAADGKPTACQVTRSSKNADLDKASCDLMMQHGRFTPTTDATGKPVAGTFRSSIKWQLPDGPDLLPAPSRFTEIFDVAPTGKVLNCAVTITGAMLAKYPEAANDYCAKIGPFVPPAGANGMRVTKHVVVENSVVITDVP